MAETTETTATIEQQPSLTKEDIQAAVAESITNSMANLKPAERAVTQQEPAKDPWEDILNPVLEPKLAQSRLRAEAAEDRAEFYSSDTWLEDANEFLLSDDPTKAKAEKAALKIDIEKTFNDLIANGRGMKREDIFNYKIGQLVTKKRVEYQESIGKKRSKKQSDLERAQKGVEFQTGMVSNYDTAQIFDLPEEKLIEQFGSLTF